MGGQSALIQLILLAAVAVVAVLLTRSTADARHQAIRRLSLMGFVVAAVFSIIFPEWLSRAANAVGVGRGTDLLLYGLVIAFLSYISTSHRRMNLMSRRITLLTRELTLAEARGERGPGAASLAPTDREDLEDRGGPTT
ncbi:DUF2304 domain-containing protein [Sanguibacter sp. Leaf3]|uniref:DUF2304 domain-containing protein n=1 Tax=Sanguibacter sp. Leaf3 TaxID=1736209 RepID=UPI0009EC7AAA|nr:DUF2304 domain-containing protein [Sanguibacter sp. Leaf3]